MTRVDRDALLGRTDLSALADELLGPRRGAGTNAKWRCPAHQPQTGRTPPLGVFVTTKGEQRWHCHACGAGGTAIDLVMVTCGVSVRGALDALTARARLSPLLPAVRPVRATTAPSPEGAAIVADHVQRCATLLWTRSGAPVRDWLHARGFTDETLRVHRVGADPGPPALERAPGLPRGGPAAIFPVLDHDRVVYFQARYLDPGRAGDHKYDNPRRTLAANPRLADLGPHTARRGPVFVCEGLPDALSVRQCGHAAVAVLGVGLAGPELAGRLHARCADAPLRIAFDADDRGTAMRDVLVEHLVAQGHLDVAVLALPAGVHDLNDWLGCDPEALRAGLDTVVQVGAGLPLQSVTEAGVALEL